MNRIFLLLFGIALAGGVVFSPSAVADDRPITVFGVLEKTTIEPVGVTYLSLTEFQGGPTRNFLLALEEDLIDQDKLVGRAALVSLSSKVTPAPQTGVLHPVLSITLFPKLATLKGTLKVNLTHGGYLVSLTTAAGKYGVKLGEKSTLQVEKLGIGEHADVTVRGAVHGAAVAAEDIR